MLHLKDFIGKSLKTSPYYKTVKAKIITTQEARSYTNDKGEQRQMKISSIADQESVIKLIIYDSSKFEYVKEGSTVIIKNFIPKEDTIVVTKNSKIALTSGIDIPQHIVEEAYLLLNPPPPPVIPLTDAKLSPLKTRLTVRGKVIQEEIKKEVSVKGEPVPIRNITIKDKSEKCKVTLWREHADNKIETGNYITITNVVVNNYKNDVSLSTTVHSNIQISEPPVEIIRTKVVGYSVQPDNITVLCDSEEVDELVVTQKILKTLLPFETDEQMNKNLLLLCDSVVKFHLKGNEILDMEIVNDE